MSTVRLKSSLVEDRKRCRNNISRTKETKKMMVENLEHLLCHTSLKALSTFGTGEICSVRGVELRARQREKKRTATLHF